MKFLLLASLNLLIFFACDTPTKSSVAGSPGAIYLGRQGGAYIPGPPGGEPISAFQGSARGGASATGAGWTVVGVAEPGSASGRVLRIDRCADVVAQIAEIGEYIPRSDILLRNAEVLGVSADGRRVAISEASDGEVPGVAIVDGGSGNLIAFVPELRAAYAGIRYLPAAAPLRSGGFVILGRRGRGEERVYVIRSDGSVVDSISKSDIAASSDDIFEAIPYPSGTKLLIGTSSSLVQFDLSEFRVTARGQRLGRGGVNIFREGKVLNLDVGIWPDHPGSGFIYVIAPDLQTYRRIDVSTPLGGSPGTAEATVTRNAAIAPDGILAYVVAGTSHIGPSFPPQDPKILVVNLQSGEIEYFVDVGAFGLGNVEPLVTC